MIDIVWRYRVKPEHRAQFETAYGPAGAWALLFARHSGFTGTRLLRGEDDSYLTLDRWRSREDFDSFIAGHEAEYRALDASTEGWTESEERLGIFEPLD